MTPEEIFQDQDKMFATIEKLVADVQNKMFETISKASVMLNDFDLKNYEWKAVLPENYGANPFNLTKPMNESFYVGTTRELFYKGRPIKEVLENL